MKLSAFRTDNALAVKGVKINIGQGAWIKVARLGNSNYRKALADYQRDHGKEAEFDPDLSAEYMNRILAETVFLGAGGLKDDDGKDLDFSTVDARAKILADPDYIDFRVLVIECANNREAFRKAEIEKSVKN